MSNIFDPSYIAYFLPRLVKALPVTLLITAVAAAGGLAIGFVVAVIKIKEVPVLKRIATVYVSFMRGTPLLVQLYISYYGLPILIEVINYKIGTNFNVNNIPAIVFVFVTFSLNEGAYNSEMIRSAILAVNKNEIEAAYSLGMTGFQVMKRVIIPQAVVVALPNFGNSLVGLLKSTSLAFMVAVVDIMGQAKIVAGRNVRFFEVYIAAAVIYWAVCIVIEFAAKRLEGRLDIKHKAQAPKNKYEKYEYEAGAGADGETAIGEAA